MYEGRLFRPPSEANSLIIQVTIGCSHNACSFCSMYKEKSFRVRSIEAIRESIQQMKLYYTNPKRMFLADGDAFILSYEQLNQIISEIKSEFPSVERISAYATPRSILLKSQEELIQLKSQGLSMLYLGIESGDDEILNFINKGATASEIIEAGQKAVQAGVILSVTLISGLGGKERSTSHAIESARVVSEINPQYIGLLTLMLDEQAPIINRLNELTLLTPYEVMLETYEFIKHLNVSNAVFRSNHASNYASLAGSLPVEKDKLLISLEHIINNQQYKKEQFRQL